MEVCRLQGDLPTDASRASCLTLTNGCDGPRVTGVIKGASRSKSVNSRTRRGDGDEDDIEMGGLYTPTAFPSGLRWTEGKQNTYFFAFSPQYFSDDFPVLVWAFLVGPQSPMDFSNGLPMDFSNGLPMDFSNGLFQWTNSKPTPE